MMLQSAIQNAKWVKLRVSDLITEMSVIAKIGLAKQRPLGWSEINFLLLLTKPFVTSVTPSERMILQKQRAIQAFFVY